jgi:hypothetical protein
MDQRGATRGAICITVPLFDNRTWCAVLILRASRDVKITEAHALGCRRIRRSSHSRYGGSASDSRRKCQASTSNTPLRTRSRWTSTSVADWTSASFRACTLRWRMCRSATVGSEIASAAQASLRIELFPLLHKEIRMDSVGLKHVRISIERQRDGRFNFETRTEIKRTFPPTNVARVSLSDATLLYTDQQSGKGLEVDSCDVDVRHLQLSKTKSAAPLESIPSRRYSPARKSRQKTWSCPK